MIRLVLLLQLLQLLIQQLTSFFVFSQVTKCSRMLFLEATELLLRLVKLFLNIIVVALQATRLPLRLLQTAVKLFDTLILSLKPLTQSLDLFRSHFLCFGRRRTYAIAWLCWENLILENSTSD